MTLLQLFHKCAYDISYQTVGDGVSYAFVEEGSTLYIYFQGSSETTDWIRNFLFKKKPYKDMAIPYKVHSGFLSAWKEVEDIIIEKITERITRDPTKEEKMNGVLVGYDYKWKKIIIVGYSHGGALAAFCHECCWYWRPDLREKDLEGYGFEAPRIYGSFFVAKELQKRWETFRVVRTNNDIVTYCPPWIFGYCHVGKVLQIYGDTSLVKNKLPKCIKSHYPEVVQNALLKK